jgi:amino acid adenylation domain-containing protein
VSISELVDRRAAETPDAPAVRCRGETLTYRELSERSSRLAHELRERGVGPERLVGVCLERSPDAIVALLGILKAGAAYVPVDVDNPAERIAFILADARPALVITRGEMVTRLPETRPATLYVDRDGDRIARHPDAPPPCCAGPENLAYVLYTSGSTGRPKGVAVERRSLLDYVLHAARAYEADRGSGAPLHSPLGFDLTVTALFAPLVRGRTVTLVPADDDPLAELPLALAEGGYSFLKLTPSHLRALAGLLEPARAGAARRLVVGGEALHGEALGFWKRHAPDVLVVNEYGPTEATVGCTAFEIRAGDAAPGPVPIGRALPTARLRVLDDALRPVHRGEDGELCIGGPCLARGYLRDPRSTAERFVPDADGPPGSRAYRTGDRVRTLPGGDLEFVGRVDDQVKIRGFRVEPGEVEAHLLRLSSVASAAVVADEDAHASSLTAYVTAADPTRPPAPSELAAELALVLPSYMVPGAFVVLDELPLLHGGKLDRRALPAPERALGEAPPRTETERVLAGIWAEALTVDEPGVEADFFELGGQSLAAAQIVSCVRDRLGVELGVRAVFDARTVQALAARIDAARSADPDAEPPPAPELPATATGEADLAPASEQQRYFWFLQQMQPSTPVVNVIATMRVDRELDGDEVRGALRAVLRRHTALRSCLRLEGDTLVQAPVDAEAIPLRFVQVRHAGEATARALEWARRVFDLEREPPARCLVTHSRTGETAVALVIHHAAVDGSSFDIVFADLVAALEGRLGDRPAGPDYGDYARWQELEVDRLATVRFWADRLAARDGPAAPHAPASEFSLVREEVLDADELVAAAQGTASRAGVSLGPALIAGLGRLFGSDDGLVLGLIVSNRMRPEFRRTVGPFVRLLPLPVGAHEGEPIEEASRRAQLDLAEALDHQELALDDLGAELRRRRLEFEPPDVIFNLALEGDLPAALGGRPLRFEFEEISDESGLADLSLSLRRTNGRWRLTVETRDAGLFGSTAPEALIRGWTEQYSAPRAGVSPRERATARSA